MHRSLVQPFVTEKTATKWRVGHDTDTQFPAHRNNVFFQIPRVERPLLCTHAIGCTACARDMTSGEASLRPMHLQRPRGRGPPSFPRFPRWYVGSTGGGNTCRWYRSASASGGMTGLLHVVARAGPVIADLRRILSRFRLYLPDDGHCFTQDLLVPQQLLGKGCCAT
ncbi:MAG: hypothetical protein CM1200mP9_02030 [Gammaproteobacteria bacterium]|nr:MAG: hypothetical protein CM1200mP9_02030 [Gammaproteobacteria bacterium]